MRGNELEKKNILRKSKSATIYDGLRSRGKRREKDGTDQENPTLLDELEEDVLVTTANQYDVFPYKNQKTTGRNHRKKGKAIPGGIQEQTSALRVR